jgi:hypothetical protein
MNYEEMWGRLRIWVESESNLKTTYANTYRVSILHKIEELESPTIEKATIRKIIEDCILPNTLVPIYNTEKLINELKRLL